MLLTLPELSPWAYPLLFGTGFAAGLVDAMAGGGGLITVPVLLNLGLPAPLALGTNKLQASFGSVSAAVHFTRHKVVDLDDCWLGIILTALGAFVGAFCIQALDPAFMGKLIPWLLLGLVIYAFCKPKVGREAHAPKIGRRLFFLLFGLGLGFYDGFFGPGAGSFWTMAFILLLGQNFMQATGHTKVMNATSNVCSLLLFALAGQIVVSVGLVMAAGQLLGARLGAGLVVKKGSRFVQPVFLTMVCITIARLIWVNYLR